MKRTPPPNGVEGKKGGRGGRGFLETIHPSRPLSLVDPSKWSHPRLNLDNVGEGCRYYLEGGALENIIYVRGGYTHLLPRSDGYRGPATLTPRTRAWALECLQREGASYLTILSVDYC